MSYYVIIRGPLGVGKSTIAKKLAKALNSENISIDKILEEQGLDEIDPTINRIPTSNFIKANEIAIKQAKELLNENRTIVFDGNFYYKEALSHLIEGLPYEHYIFTLKASLKTCIERDNDRKSSYGKDATTVVYNLVSVFDYGISIDTNNKSPEEIVKFIISRLPK